MTAIEGNTATPRGLEQALSAAGAVPGNSNGPESAQGQPQQQGLQVETDTVEISGRGSEQTQDSGASQANLGPQAVSTTDSTSASSTTESPTAERPVQGTEAENEVPGRNVDRFA